MADAIEIASAYVALTTKMPGVKQDIAASLGDAEGVSKDAGSKAGKGFGLALVAGITAAAVAVSQRMTVHPVPPRRSVSWPTRMPGTSVMALRGPGCQPLTPRHVPRRGGHAHTTSRTRAQCRRGQP